MVWSLTLLSKNSRTTSSHTSRFFVVVSDLQSCPVSCTMVGVDPGETQEERDAEALVGFFIVFSLEFMSWAAH
jgi:hypothetical protein